MGPLHMYHCYINIRVYQNPYVQKILDTFDCLVCILLSFPSVIFLCYICIRFRIYNIFRIFYTVFLLK